MAFSLLMFTNRDLKYDCGTNCGWKHPLNKGRRNNCKEISKCSCDCEKLDVISPQLGNACKGSCNSDKVHSDHQDFKCNVVGGQVLYDMYNVRSCGFDAKDSVSYQNQTLNQGFNKQSNMIRLILIIALLAMIGLMGMELMKPKKSTA